MAKSQFWEYEDPTLVPPDQRQQYERVLRDGPSHLSFFGSFVMEGTSLDQVGARYANWVLSQDDYSHNRMFDLSIGLDKNLLPSDVYPGELSITSTPEQLRNHEILTRKVEQGWHLRLRKWRLAPTPTGVIRCLDTHQARLTDLGGGRVLVEHAWQQKLPPGSRGRPAGGTPRIVEDLHAESLKEETGDWTAGDLANLVVDAERTMPVLLIVPRRRPGEDRFSDPRCDWGFVWQSLFGTVLIRDVVDEEGTPSPHASISKALKAKGLPDRLLPPDGGIRLYMPGLAATDPEEDHRIWSPTFFERNGSPRSEGMLVSEVRALTADFLMPKDFLRSIQIIDAERLEAQEQPEAHPVVAPPSLVEELKSQLDEFAQENDLVTSELRRVENLLVAETARADDFEYKLKTLASRPAEKQIGDQGALERALEESLGGSPSLEHALLYFQHLFPSRVVILPSAMDSARDAEEFRFRSQAFRLLRILVTDYWRAMAVEGGGDAKARLVFGNKAFAAHESETAAGNAIARAQRTVVYKGRQMVLEPHLRIGAGDGGGETLRIHFEWDPEDKCIIIGHCGRHLDHR